MAYKDYNYYDDVQSIYNAKVGWNNATTDEERQKQSKIADDARKRLTDYGYKDIADQMSASGADATAARKVMENLNPNKSKVETNNLKSNEVNRENAGLFDKYNEQYDYLTTTNPFETETAKAILAKYDLAGLQGRDNAVASGSATNGGNIDSYAAANALRQQASLVNQGQMAVLDAHQQKIDNVRGLLSDMGVNIDRVFTQDETSKNDQTARLSEEANVTGYVPNEWTIKNDDIYSQFLNEDGTFKKEMENVDIQTLINQTSDPETKNKLAVVRTRKILGNYGDFGQYSNMGDIASMKPQQTEAGRQFDEQIDASVEIAKGENDTKLAISEREAALAEQTINASLEAARIEGEKDAYAAYNTFLSMWDEEEVEKKAFIEKFIKPVYEGKQILTPEQLKQCILENTARYNIDVDDAKMICNAFDVDATWLNGYRDRTESDGEVTWYNEKTQKGQYGGMVKKST